MSPERLLMIAVRRGLDLSLIASRRPSKRERPSFDPIVARRQLRMVAKPEKDARGKPNKLTGQLERSALTTAKGRSSPRSKAPAWTSQDFASACRGMPELEYTILCYTVFGSDDDRIKLKANLMVLAVDLARREHWPKTVRRANCFLCHRACRDQYLEDLCTLALLEWVDPDTFRSQESLARWFGITQGYWSKLMAKKYQALLSQLEFWYGGAMIHIHDALHGPRDTQE